MFFKKWVQKIWTVGYTGASIVVLCSYISIESFSVLSVLKLSFRLKNSSVWQPENGEAHLKVIFQKVPWSNQSKKSNIMIGIFEIVLFWSKNIQCGISIMSWVDPHPSSQKGMDRLNKRVWIDSRRHWRSTLYLWRVFVSKFASISSKM